MRKRKINPQYLKHITSQEVTNTKIDAFDFASSIKHFAEEYLTGIMTVEINGVSRGWTNLKLPVASYLIRLLCENTKDDEMLKLDISIGEDIVMTAHFESPCSTEDVAYAVKVARLAGFDVSRDGNFLIFKASVTSDAIMQIYATSREDFGNILVVTFKM